MEKKIYYKRIIDKKLDLNLRAFGATNIIGPKWCGKTFTAEQRVKSKLMLQKEPDLESLEYKLKLTPYLLLEGEKPKLIDEWQDLPLIYDVIRAYCDEFGGKGNFILTGSTSKNTKTRHTGTGRISTLKMYPMSLYESKESSGVVSLLDLFDKKENLEKGCVSFLSLEDLIYAACRGGWPESVLMEDKEAALIIPKDLYKQIYTKDMFNVDNVKRNPSTMRAILNSYGRNISTLAKKVSILKDVRSTNNISEETLDDYINVLEKLYIVEDLYGWCPNIRSASAIRSGRKREFVDPSIAVVSENGSPSFYLNDLKTFGFIFETLCIRDLRVYSSALDGEISYYRDKYDLECDAVLHLNDGRYALIEFKLGDFEIDKGAQNLNKIEDLIKKHNENNDAKIRMPDLKLIITASQYGFKRDDGIFVVPISCLKD